MDEEKHAGATPRYRSREEAARLVAEFETSGLRRREFCAQQDLTVSTLDAYRKRFGRRTGAKAESKTAAQSRWVAVELRGGRPTSGGGRSGLALALANGRRIEISPGFDAGTLRQLVRVLEQI